MKSALAFAALTTPSITSEQQIYENIVAIPHYHSKYSFFLTYNCLDHALSLLDKEDESIIIESNFKEFQEMYHPVWQDNFKDIF